MASTIIIKNKNSGAPSSLIAGELAINTTDGGIYYGSTNADTGTSVSSSFMFGMVTASVVSASGNVEGGSLRADDLTAGRVAFVGTDGLLVDDSDLTFATDTLTSTNLASTTVDTTNLEVTTIKAKDGTAAGSIADSTGVVTLASSVLTTSDINGGTIDGCNITVGAGKTLELRDIGTLNIANDGISGNAIEGGTIGSTTITTLTTAAINASTDIDIGSHDLKAQTLTSDVATGTAPLTVESTTEVTNLKAATVGTIAGLAPNTATTQATQAAITTCANLVTIGTIGTGVWQGTAVASAYLDADTAHLTTTQTFTGTKTFNEAINKKAFHYIHTAFKAMADMDTERYVSLVDADREATAEDAVSIVAVMPADGVLKKVIWNTSSNLSEKSWTFRFKKITNGTAYTGETTLATVTKQATSGMGGSNTNSIIDFSQDIDADNACDNPNPAFSAGDRVLFSYESNEPPSGTPKCN